MQTAARGQLTAALGALRNADGGWPYYRGRRSRLEPTSWAMLATGTPFDTTPLGSWIGADGLLVEPATPHANFAFNGLAALAVASSAAPARVLAGVLRGLVAARGESAPANPAARMDSSLQGWSWMAGTFSWVEPTAWCTLALKRRGNGTASAERIAVGERVLRDRVCADGGWNYGNSEVFGQALPAHVPPTAGAVLALQDLPNDALLTRAASFLEVHALQEGSTTSLALSALALRMLNRDVSAITGRLAAHVPSAIAFGNAAALAMAACALGESALQDALRLPTSPAR